MTHYPGPISLTQFPESRLVSASSDSGSGTSRAAVSECPPKEWGIEEIKLTCAGKSSKSYDDPNHAAIAGDDGSRFHFAPMEETVTIEWKLKNPEDATTLTIHIYRSGSKTPVLAKVLAADEARKGKIENWKGELASGVANVGHSPYKVVAFAGDGRAKGLEERFTYFDVKIEKIELSWGGAVRIPGGAPNGVGGSHSAATIASETALVTALEAQKRGDETLDPAHRYEVALPCNNFLTYVYNMECPKDERKTTLSMAHKDQWGDGPRIPLIAKIHVAKAAGGGVHGGDSAEALEGVRLMWDWCSEDEIAALGTHGHNAKVETFLRNSLDYRRNDPDGPPGSTNCHVDHGGKRGPGRQVFLALPGMGSHAAYGTTRTWALVTDAKTSGNDAGCAGVVFSPSRIARDTYIVSVFATHDHGAGGPATIDTADTTDQLRTDHANLPNAKSGTFEVLRKVRMRYNRKSGAVQSALLAQISGEYKKAGVVLDFGAQPDADEATLGANYNAWFANAVNNPDPKGRPKINPYGGYMETADQFQAGTGADTGFAAIGDSYEKVIRKLRVDAVREYCNQKRRLYNAPKRAYDGWLRNNLPANDHQYLLPYYDNLSARKQRAVDEIFTRHKADAGITDQPSYESGMEGAAIEIARLIAESLQAHVNEPGMTVLHVDAPMGYRMNDDSIHVPPSGAGGLSPSTSATKFNGTGAVHLVFIPQTPSADPTAKYRVPVTGVITHEAGHNLYLCHAPGRGVPNPAGTQEGVHDSTDDLCLMSYCHAADHLCGYCNLKLRGYGTLKKRGKPDDTGPVEDGTRGLSNISANNKVP